MGLEIERKYLVRQGAWNFETLSHFYLIQQGYLESSSALTLRVRTLEKDSLRQAFLTLKSAQKGRTRLEFEYEIPWNDAKEMLKNFCRKSAIIVKKRYVVDYAGKQWEIDVFEGENAGLVLAEIELNHENEDFVLPPWVSEEVTHDFRYTNAYLAEHPYTTWK